MKFNIKRVEFVNAVNKILKLVNLKSLYTSLNAIKITIEDDNLILIASDSDTSVKVNLNNDSENIIDFIEEGDCLVAAKLFGEIIKKIEDDYIELSLFDKRVLKIVSETSDYTLNTLSVEDFPFINFHYEGSSLNIDGLTYRKAINSISYACGNNIGRPIIMGINFKVINSKLFLHATDTYRLARKVINCSYDNDIEVTINSKNIIEISKFVENNQIIKIYFEKEKTIFVIDNMIIYLRNINGQFPDTSKGFLNENEINISIDCKHLYGPVDRSLMFINDSNPNIKFSINDDYIKISTINNELGSFSEIIKNVVISGRNLDIFFDPSKILDVLKVIDVGEVLIGLYNETSAVSILNAQDSSEYHVIVPVRNW